MDPDERQGDVDTIADPDRDERQGDVDSVADPPSMDPEEANVEGTFVVEKPKLGLLVPVGPGKFVAAVGGPPKPDLSELVKQDPFSQISAGRHRPTDTAAALKGEQVRVKGLDSPITMDSKIRDEADKIEKHLVKFGMDSICYFKDPADPTKAISCVSEYPLFSPSKMEQLCKDRYNLYDGYDRRNDDEAVEFLLNSVDESLKRHLDATSKGKPFGHYFANLVAKLQQGTSDRIEEIKTKIKTIKASDYSGEDIDALWADVKKLVEELEVCSAYDHRLTKELAMMLQSAGGTGSEAEQYRHAIRDFVSKYNKVLEDAVFLPDKVKDAEMKANGCMPVDLFRVAGQEYRFLFNSKRWPPARNVADIPGALPVAVANAVPTHSPRAVGSDVQAFAHALLQVMKQGTDSANGQKQGACYNCGEAGHLARDCPKQRKSGGPSGPGRHSGRVNGKDNSSGKHQRQRQQNKDKGRRTDNAWKTQAPGATDPKEKTVSGRKFYWCAKCSRWTTSHTTATHVVKGGAANMVPAFDNFAWCAPVDTTELFQAKASVPGSVAKPSEDPAPHRGRELFRLLGWFSLGIGYSLGVFSACLNFSWWANIALASLDWLAQHYTKVVLLVLWFGMLAIGVSLPWLLLPPTSPTRTPDPNPNPVKETRRLRRYRTQQARRLKKIARSRPCGASRLGYHRSFPLRCRNENLHTKQYGTPARHRLDASNFNLLAEAVRRFATQFFPPVGRREGDQGETKRQAKDKNISAKPPKVERVWVQNERGEWVQRPKAAKAWRQNASGEWVRFDRKDPLEHPVHQASTKPPKQQFLTKKAKANFARIIKDAFGKGRQPDPEPPKPKRHPIMAPTKRKAIPNAKPSDFEIHLTNNQMDAFDEIFGTPKYFAFVAQEDLSADVKKLCTRIRNEYLSGKGRPPTRKASKLPVIWDSGASVCVSFDRNDFVGPIQPLANPSRLRGFFRNGPRIRGVGHVAWSFEDTNGNLRTLKLPAMYVPEVKQRLLSTTCLLQAHPNESLTVLPEGMWLSGDGDKLGSIEVLTDSVTNLPTAYAYSYTGSQSDSPDGASFAAPIPVASTVNANLSDAQRELVRWHQKLGHASYRRVQFLLRSGVLAHTEATRRLHAAAAKLRPEGCPLCAACQFGKQRRRPAPGKASSVVREVAGALRRDDLFPGQRISVDHFICSTRGRLLNTRGKESEKEKYTGGCIFVDHASGFVHVELQVFITAAETLKAKQKFEQLCRDYGVAPHSYQADNGAAFTSAAFAEHLATRNQTIRYAGTGAHHHNGIAERAIQSIMSRARTMLLHAALHWPDATNTQLWPFAVRQAVHLHNFVPDPSTGLSPNDLFTKTKHPSKRFFDLHPLFCPAYALDKSIADGHKLPRWNPRSERYIFVGFSDKRTSTVPLLLNPRTGAIVTNYHVVFDDWFTTVSSDPSRLPDFGTDEWERLFGDSAFQFVLDESDVELLALAEEDNADAVLAGSHVARSTSIESAMARATQPPPRPPAGPPAPMVAVETPRLAQGQRLEQQRELSTPTTRSTMARPAPTIAQPAPTVSQPARLIMDRESLVDPAPTTANTTQNLTPTPTVQTPLASPRNFERETTATQVATEAKTAKSTASTMAPTRRSSQKSSPTTFSARAPCPAPPTPTSSPS
jgi:Zinc knuckle